MLMTEMYLFTDLHVFSFFFFQIKLHIDGRAYHFKKRFLRKCE